MKKILFTTDFDKNAPAMLKYTALFAEVVGASITLFHAYGTGAYLSKEAHNKIGMQRLEALHQLVEDYLPEKFNEIPLEYMVDKEYAFDAIPKIADEETYDFVVLGLKNSSHSLLGLLKSITLEVLLDVNCNVLIVPEFFRTDQISEIGCTTDFEFRDIALLIKMQELGKKIGKDAAIYCLHVVEKDADEKRAQKDWVILKSIFDKPKRTPIYFTMETGKLTPIIEKWATNNELDLLVMNTHQRDAVGKVLDISLTKDVVQSIRVPLLLLKEL